MSLQFNFKNHEPLVFQLDDDAELRFELSFYRIQEKFRKLCLKSDPSRPSLLGLNLPLDGVGLSLSVLKLMKLTKSPKLLLLLFS